MLLIWLFLLPSAAAMGCRSVCSICAVEKSPETIACAICRDCRRSTNRRMIERSTQTIPTLSYQQKEELRELERKEFKQVMKDYGIGPEDLVDSEEKSEEEYDENNCIPLLNCIVAEDFSGKLIKDSKCAKGQNNCLTSPTSPCPPVKPCKKVFNKPIAIGKEPSLTTSTSPSIMPLNKIVTLNVDYKDDRGCPTQPSCSDEDLTKTASAATPTSRKKRLKKFRPTSCLPCVPLCALPCGLTKPDKTASIPEQTTEDLAKLTKPTTAKNKTPNTIKNNEEENEGRLVTNAENSGGLTESTKKYIYLYAGIPKDVTG